LATIHFFSLICIESISEQPSRHAGHVFLGPKVHACYEELLFNFSNGCNPHLNILFVVKKEFMNECLFKRGIVLVNSDAMPLQC